MKSLLCPKMKVEYTVGSSVGGHVTAELISGFLQVKTLTSRLLLLLLRLEWREKGENNIGSFEYKFMFTALLICPYKLSLSATSLFAFFLKQFSSCRMSVSCSHSHLHSLCSQPPPLPSFCCRVSCSPYDASVISTFCNYCCLFIFLKPTWPSHVRGTLLGSLFCGAVSGPFMKQNNTSWWRQTKGIIA